MQSYHTDAPSVRKFFDKHFSETKLLDLRATEGLLGGGLDSKLEEAGEEAVQAWAQLLFDRFSGDDYLGCADHLLAVLRK